MRAMFAAVLFLAITGFPPHVAIGMPDGDMQVTAASTVRQEPAPPIETGITIWTSVARKFTTKNAAPGLSSFYCTNVCCTRSHGMCAGHLVPEIPRRAGTTGAGMAARIRPKGNSPAEDLHILLQHLNVRRAVVVDSSGGSLAIDFALAHPDQVDGLMLIGPVVSGMGFTDQFESRAQLNSAPLKTGDVGKLLPRTGRKILTSLDLAKSRFEKALRRADSESTEPHTSQRPRDWNTSAATTLSQIQVPTLNSGGRGGHSGRTRAFRGD